MRMQGTIAWTRERPKPRMVSLSDSSMLLNATIGIYWTTQHSLDTFRSSRILIFDVFWHQKSKSEHNESHGMTVAYSHIRESLFQVRGSGWLPIHQRRMTTCFRSRINNYHKEGTGVAAYQHWALLEDVKEWAKKLSCFSKKEIFKKN